MQENSCKEDPRLLTALSAAGLLLPGCIPPSLCWIISKRWMYFVSDRSGSWVGTGDFLEVDGGNLKKENKVVVFFPSCHTPIYSHTDSNSVQISTDTTKNFYIARMKKKKKKPTLGSFVYRRTKRKDVLVRAGVPVSFTLLISNQKFL